MLARCLVGHQYMHVWGPNSVQYDGFHFKKLTKTTWKAVYFFLKEKIQRTQPNQYYDFTIITYGTKNAFFPTGEKNTSADTPWCQATFAAEQKEDAFKSEVAT